MITAGSANAIMRMSPHATVPSKAVNGGRRTSVAMSDIVQRKSFGNIVLQAISESKKIE